MAQATHQLFHEIADPASAAIRRRVVEAGLKDRIDFRNVAYPEARADFDRLGGSQVPALWDGSRLHVGPEPIRRELDRLAGSAGATEPAHRPDDPR
jgi:hypothetical protein